jgi:hypothetical protein
MRSEVRGYVLTEDLIDIALRLVAALQDAGVSHVRDVTMAYQPTDANGLDFEVGTLAGRIDVLPRDCGHLARPMAASRIRVMRPTSGRRPRRRASRDHSS